MVCRVLNRHLTICSDTYKGLFHRKFHKLILFTPYSDKNFEMSRIHFSWFVLYGGDDGAGGFDEEKLERRPRELMRRRGVKKLVLVFCEMVVGLVR